MKEALNKRKKEISGDVSETEMNSFEYINWFEMNWVR